MIRMDTPMRRPPKGWPIILQTWPARVPEFRSFVHCHMARQVPISEHDAGAARDIALASDAPGLILLEWDIALDGDDFRSIARASAEEPDLGFVAPYKLWPGPTWAHRIMEPHGDERDWWEVTDNTKFRFAGPDDWACNLPCFGCIYIPRDILAAWEPPPHDPRFTDSNFALWARAQGLWWAIRWDVHPVHVHY